MEDVEFLYWQAFCDLSSERRDGGQIPWSSVRQYWEIEGFDDFQTFKAIIGAMDSAAIDARKKQQENR